MAVTMVGFEATREVAEAYVKKAMAPLRKIIEEYREEPDGSTSVSFTLHDVRSVDADLGVIGSILATQYSHEETYQKTIQELAAENVRVHGAVDVLANHLTAAYKDIETLANRLNKTETVNDKLKELTPVKSGFKKPSMV